MLPALTPPTHGISQWESCLSSRGWILSKIIGRRSSPLSSYTARGSLPTYSRNFQPGPSVSERYSKGKLLCHISCLIVNPFYSRIVETVLDVWTMMQEHWKLGACKFVGPEEFERGEASGVAYKSIYHFDRTKPKPAVFPTREFYGATFQSQETAKALDQELESLISTTSLVVAKYPIGLAYIEGILYVI